MIRVLQIDEKLFRLVCILITIGPYHLPSQVLLAPMAGVTDLPFRQLCQASGAGLTTSEMVIAKTEHWASEKSRLRFAATDNTKVPHSIQIVGSDAQQMANAAKLAADAGAEIIDINMGCPAKKVCKKAAGSALMRDERLVAEILAAVIANVSVPVTLKIRTGWDSEHKNALHIAHIAQESGIAALAIHGRTRACRFVGEVEYDTIAAVKQAIDIPVFANGDINTVEQALKVAKYTQADGIMIGRGAQGQPWLIAQIVAAMANDAFIPLSLTQKCALMLDHLLAMHQFYGEFKGLRLARKHMAAYLEKLGLEKTIRQQFNRLDSVDAQTVFVKQLAHKTLV